MGDAADHALELVIDEWLDSPEATDWYPQDIPVFKPKPVGGKCPLCGSPAVNRTNKSTGQQFIGCSAFPKCRYSCDGHL